MLSVKLIISKKGGKGQGNRDAPYNIIMFTIMIVTITIIIQGESEETAMLLYTSGATSGSPRGVTLSHAILGKQVHIVQSWLISVILSVPDLHLQNLQPADRAGCGRLGLDFGGQCASLHWPRVNLRTYQLTAGDLSPDFLLFFGVGFYFLF